MLPTPTRSVRGLDGSPPQPPAGPPRRNPGPEFGMGKGCGATFSSGDGVAPHVHPLATHDQARLGAAPSTRAAHVAERSRVAELEDPARLVPGTRRDGARVARRAAARPPVAGNPIVSRCRRDLGDLHRLLATPFSVRHLRGSLERTSARIQGQGTQVRASQWTHVPSESA
jgi:hypothetical protein